MSNGPLDRARSKMDALSTELGSILSLHGEDESKWNPGILERHNRLIKGLDRATLEYDALSARGDKIEQIRAAAQDPANRESGFGGRALAPSSHSATRAWDGYDSRGSIGALDSDDGLRSRALIAAAEMDGLEPASRSKLTEMIEKDKGSGEARAVLALGNPAYRSAFDKWFIDPVSAAMQLTASEGAAWRDVSAYRAAMGETRAPALVS